MANGTFKIESNLKNVIKELEQAVHNALEEASSEVEAKVKQYSKVDTGQTKASYDHVVNDSEHVAYVGSSYENAIWEEFGTGIYALNGNGRKTSWVYTPDNGQTFYRTKGKKPRRPLHKALNDTRPKIEKYFQEKFRGMNK